MKKKSFDPMEVLAFILNSEKNEAEKVTLFKDYSASLIKETRKTFKTARNAYTHPHTARKRIEYTQFVASIANNAEAVKFDIDNLMRLLEQLTEIPRSIHNKLLIISIESMLRSVNEFKKRYPYQSQQAN